MADFIERLNKISLRKMLLALFIIIGSLVVSAGVVLISKKIISIYPSVLAQDILNLQVALRNLILPTLITVFLTLGVVVSYKYQKTGKFIIFLLLVGELFRFGWKYTPFVNREYVFPETEVLTYLKSDPDTFRVDRLKSELLPPNTWAAYRLMSPSGYDPMAPENNVLTFQKKLNLVENPTVSRYSELDRVDAGALGDFNVKYLLALKRDKIGDIRETGMVSHKIVGDDWKVAGNWGSVSLLENKSVKPRVELMNHDGGGQVKVLEYQANAIKIAYSSEVESSVILRDAWYPGWTAKIDDREYEVYMYDDFFRRIDVPAGEDKILYIVYRPRSFSLGLTLSGLSMVGLVLLCWKRKSFLV